MLVDTGFGADVPALLRWLQTQGVAPSALGLIVNTHFHCDHSGGNHALQALHGVFIAAQAEEAALVNCRDPDACRADWLRQPIEPYQVDRRLRDGDMVSAGRWAWQVVETPGHTAGHISLYSAEHGILVLGDALHDADLGWLNPYREGAGLPGPCGRNHRAAVERSRPGLGYSGHGPAITDLPKRRWTVPAAGYASWRAESPAGSHGTRCKRIFSHAT